MPRYFFHVREKAAPSTATGRARNSPTPEAARREAISSSREMLSEKLLHGGSLNGRNIEIADETGVVDVVNSRELFQFRSYSEMCTYAGRCDPIDAHEFRRANRRKPPAFRQRLAGRDQPEKIFLPRPRQSRADGRGALRMGMIAADDGRALARAFFGGNMVARIYFERSASDDRLRAGCIA